MDSGVHLAQFSMLKQSQAAQDRVQAFFVYLQGRRFALGGGVDKCSAVSALQRSTQPA